MRISGGAGLQAAIISPRKEGWFERNLHRQGDLMMGDAVPEPGKEEWVRRDRLVVPGAPFRVDFVMLPAASIALELAGEDGGALAGANVYVDGDELPPACSVLLSEKAADAEGKVLFEEVPVGYAWRIWLGEDYHASVSLPSPGTHRIRVRRGIHREGGWGLLEVVSHTGPDGRPAPAVAPRDPPWTGSHGLDCRLRAEKVKWGAGEVPVVVVEARDTSGPGDRTLTFVSWTLEVDGRSYTRREGGRFVETLRQGETTPRCRVGLDAGWADERGKPLSLQPGRHVVRVGGKYVHPNGSGRLTSNRVTIEVSP
jgi:hypothetical protein